MNPLTRENLESHTIREIQYPGHVHMVAEYSAPMNNRYRTDSVYLASVYGATQGTDAICFFYMASPAWEHTLTKWPVMTPGVFGQFPAFALAFRRGDIPEQAVAVDETFDSRSRKAYTISTRGMTCRMSRAVLP